jgi:hypothetical protein
MKHTNENGITRERRISISPILTYINNYNDNFNNDNDNQDLIKSKRHLNRYTAKLNTSSDMEFEYY